MVLVVELHELADNRKGTKKKKKKKERERKAGFTGHVDRLRFAQESLKVFCTSADNGTGWA